MPDSKHTLYKGHIEEFRSMIKYMSESQVNKMIDTNKINEIAKSVKDTIGRTIGRTPKICSEDCDIIDTCPFAINKVTPDGELCPIEQYLIDNFFEELQVELHQDKDTIQASDIISIGSLTTLYVLLYRMTNKISIDGLTTIGTMKTSAGFIETQVANPMIEQIIKIQEQMQKILKNLHLLRLERAKHAPHRDKEEKDEDVSKKDFYKELAAKGINLKELSDALNNIKKGGKDETPESSNED